MINCLRHPIRQRLLPKAALALDLFLWLCWLPVALRIYGVPTLLERFSPGTRHKVKMEMELPMMIEIATRICHLRPFRSRIFPKPCLRQSLALFRTLSRMGYPAAMHFGISKEGPNFRGHSWVTMNGDPVADTAPYETFSPIYSYSSVRSPLMPANAFEPRCYPTSREAVHD